MKNQCNFAGYIATEPKKITDNLISVSLASKKKDQNGNENTTWINITVLTKTAYWLQGLQKGDWIDASNCKFEVKENNGVKYPSFFAFEVESPTLQARSKNSQGGQNQSGHQNSGNGNQNQGQQPANGNPNNGTQGLNDFDDDSIPF